MKRRGFIVALMITFICLDLCGKPRKIIIESELKYAKYIGVVEIQEYFLDENDTNFLGNGIGIDAIRFLKMKSIENDSIFNASTIKSKAMIPKYQLIDYSTRNTFTGYWPNIGDTLLVIIDSLYRISLFGHGGEDVYRIWSPYLTGSIATFRIEDPALPLSGEDSDCYNMPSGKYCWDGCLLKSDAIFINRRRK